MRQLAIQFGKNREMIGVLSLPEPAPAQSKRAVLVWNTGISHRVGPQRMNVELARTLNQLGMPVFRFDLTGRGDSAVREGSVPSVVLDVREAMDALNEQCGYEEFILHGLCSGAIEAHYVAAADRRVIGLSMIDTYAYRVGSYYRHYVLQRLGSRAAWKRLALKWMRPRTETVRAIDQFFVPFPALEAIRADFSRFAERRLPCLVIFTNGYEHVYNYHGQFRDMMKGIDLASILSEHHFREADHLFTIVEQKEKLLDTISAWISGSFL